MVGSDNFQKRPRSVTRTYRLRTACETGLWPVGSIWTSKGRHSPRQSGILWKESCTLEDGEASYLLVSQTRVPDGVKDLLYDRDAFTTSSDFIISPHAASKGLYVATCGNFHGWKFFPVLGKYVISMLEGSLSHELSEKWAWDRKRPDPKHFADWPRHEMKDLLDPARTSRL